jgi:hypothetical protein
MRKDNLSMARYCFSSQLFCPISRDCIQAKSKNKWALAFIQSDKEIRSYDCRSYINSITVIQIFVWKYILRLYLLCYFIRINLDNFTSNWQILRNSLQLPWQYILVLETQGRRLGNVGSGSDTITIRFRVLEFRLATELRNICDT